MSELYNMIAEMCDAKDITVYRMCKDIGISPSTITDLKMGRRKTLGLENLKRIADYFGVSYNLFFDTLNNRSMSNAPSDVRAAYLEATAYAQTEEIKRQIKKDPSDMTVEEVDEELYDLMTELRDNYALRQLLHAAKGTDAENIKAVAEMLERFKNN